MPLQFPYGPYNGGGTNNALQTDATAANIIASGAEMLPTVDYDFLDIWLVNSTAGQSGTLFVAEFRTAQVANQPADEPTDIYELVRYKEYPIPAADYTGTSPLKVFDETTNTTEHATTGPITADVNAGSTVMIGVSSSSGGTWYAYYHKKCKGYMLQSQGSEMVTALNSITSKLSDAAVDTNWFQATITSADATSATQVKAKTAGQKIHVCSVVMSTDTAMSLQLQSDNGTPQVVLEQVYLGANGGMAMTFPKEFPLVVNTNEDLDVIASAAGNISVTVTGYVKA